MIRFASVLRTSATVIVALLVVASPSAAQVKKQPAAQTLKQPAAQTLKQPAAKMLKRTTVDKKQHRLVLQVNTNDPAMMNLALNNATNVAQYYNDLGEKVTIEVVTFGPGLHMLRDDTSPVKARIKAIKESTPTIFFKACGNTQENMHKVENKEIPIIPEATVVKSGVVRVMELQEQGWSYVKP
jgi:intracellular sulfur oxidation DsrE/DsrF family protein